MGVKVIKNTKLICHKCNKILAVPQDDVEINAFNAFEDVYKRLGFHFGLADYVCDNYYLCPDCGSENNLFKQLGLTPDNCDLPL